VLDDYVLGIIVGYPESDLLFVEGGIEAEIGAAGEEPIADALVHPLADAADDLREARVGEAEGIGDMFSLPHAGDDESVDIEVAIGRVLFASGHLSLLHEGQRGRGAVDTSVH
jgi:hypothetical protein